jgi:hypothetical protein
MHIAHLVISAPEEHSTEYIRWNLLTKIVQPNNDVPISQIKVRVGKPKSMGGKYVYQGTLSYPESQAKKSGYSVSSIDDGLLYNSNPSVGFTWKQV